MFLYGSEKFFDNLVFERIEFVFVMSSEGEWCLFKGEMDLGDIKFFFEKY